MKTIQKYTTTFLMAIMLAVAIPVMASTASAQTRGYYSNDGRYYDYNQNQDYSYNQPNQYYGYNQPKVYDRHRKAINIGVATAAGTLLGALLGGRKGALIGAAAGAATGYVVTKKQRPRNYTYYWH